MATVANVTAAVPASASETAPNFKRILMASQSDIAVQTASAELAQATGARVVEWDRTGNIENGDIVLALDEDIRAFPPAAARLASVAGIREWELVVPAGGGLIIAGGTPRNVCKAALGWIADPAGETDRISTYEFTERFTMWDDSMNQMYRFSKGFDRRSQMREIARLGHTGVEINRYADSGGYHVRHRKFIHDSYAWYCSYAPALDAFVESSLTKGTYLPEELANNLADLHEAAMMARSYGLKPGFTCYEPRCVSEKIFDRYPELRGSRTDHPGRSLTPRYALDIAHPRVLEHYAEMTTALMAQVPDLRYFAIWVQDSGSGIPFASKLYFGPNGSFLARSKTIEGMVANFSETILKAGRKVNPEFEVIMEINDEYTDEERRSISVNLPQGVTLCHPVGGTLLSAPAGHPSRTYVREDAAAGVDPYLSIVVAAGYDAEPIIGVPAPGLLIERFAEAHKLTPEIKSRRLFTNGGLFSPPQCPYNINQELCAELIRGNLADPDQFLLATAERWCDGDHESAALLIEAWKTGDEAMRAWPRMNWYAGGGAQTQARWITRPLVPDITRLNEHERSAWERELFPLPSDIARLNIMFEAGIRYFDEDELVRATQSFDEAMLPRLGKTVELLNRALAAGGKPVIEDQRDRYRGLLLRSKTDCHLYKAQIAINNCLLKKGNPAAERSNLDAAIEAEMVNTRDWIQALDASRTNWFHLAVLEETPFLYKTPVEDLKIKLEAMEAHRSDEPGPYLKQLLDPKPTLLFSASFH
ncbi:MAG: hypothetical protein ACRD28_00590 [Acidobacteriaceae bacterium]